MSAKDAQKIAFKKNLDLVKIAPMAKPPVCQIMDYGKYCFEQAKKDKEIRRNSKALEIKEIRMFSAIDDHDYETKVKQAISFLKDGHKVKVVARFKKRAIAHHELGGELLLRFRDAVEEFGTTDKNPKFEGRNYILFITPKTKVEPKK
jgi:translation initiation factor IF-3